MKKLFLKYLLELEQKKIVPVFHESNGMFFCNFKKNKKFITKNARGCNSLIKAFLDTYNKNETKM